MNNNSYFNKNKKTIITIIFSIAVIFLITAIVLFGVTKLILLPIILLLISIGLPVLVILEINVKKEDASEKKEEEKVLAIILSGKQNIEEIAKLSGLSTSSVRGAIERCFKNGSLSDYARVGEKIVLKSEAESILNKSVIIVCKCPNCGNTVSGEKNTVVKCEYCGSKTYMQ